MENRRILIVEDDPTQFSLIKEELERKFHSIEITNIETEYDFYCDIDKVLSPPPDLILMDMMLRWTDPAPNMPEMPEEVEDGGYYRAGIRCTEKLLEAKQDRNVPILIFTVLGHEDINEDLDELISNHDGVNVSYLPKTSRVSKLIQEILNSAPGLEANLSE